jgi:cell wall-associated NlpC family hydrolase
MWTTLAIVLGVVVLPAGAAHAAGKRHSVPDWAKPALHYLVDAGWVERSEFDANAPMGRREFSALMTKAFEGGFSRTRGEVTAAEVSAALVRKLDRGALAEQLDAVHSPDGWEPGVSKWFGTEIVSRELGLRRDRATSEDAFEASASESMTQADIAWAIWQAKTSPDTWSADALDGFKIQDYSESQRAVVRYALSLVGAPYVWGGEWPSKTPEGYPYGAQMHGGFDCSGFSWYVLREKTSSWSPNDRPYKGWALDERSSYDMAGGIPRRKRIKYRELEPGDLVFFASTGRDAKASDVYHAGIYLGDGWMVHSSGSRAGISLGEIGPGAWWHDQLAWGRRVIKD